MIQAGPLLSTFCFSSDKRTESGGDAFPDTFSWRRQYEGRGSRCAELSRERCYRGSGTRRVAGGLLRARL